jgi:polar amino acid transport system substrate-binding protein
MFKTLRVITFIFFAITNNAIAETYKFVGTTFLYILEQDSSGVINGIGAELAKKIMTNLGHDIEIEIYPWKRAQLMVENGLAHALIGPYKTSEREQFLDFNSHHFYQDYMVFYSRYDNNFTWDGKLSELHNLRVGLMAGWVYGDKFDNYKNQLSIATVHSINSCFGMLLKDRIDLCALNQRSGNNYLSTSKDKNKFKQVKTPISSTKGFFGFSKKLELHELQIEFDRELKKLIDNKEVEQLNKKYGLYFMAD